MNFVADESIEVEIVVAIRNDGYKVFYIQEECPGVDDSKVLAFAFEKEAILITQDKDFGHLIFIEKKLSKGIILIRLVTEKTKEKARRVSATIDKYSDYLEDSFVVIQKEKIRLSKIE